jgi:hypothetical protein
MAVLILSYRNMSIQITDRLDHQLSRHAEEMDESDDDERQEIFGTRHDSAAPSMEVGSVHPSCLYLASH